ITHHSGHDWLPMGEKSAPNVGGITIPGRHRRAPPAPRPRRCHTRRMTSDKASSLLALHSTGPVLALVNVWDADSARLVEAAGATAQATASFSVAESRGYSDGEDMPVDVAIAAVAEVCAATSL